MATTAADSEKWALDLVRENVEQAERRHHSQLRPRWNHFDAQYHGFNRFKDAWRSASPRDQDSVLQDARGAFGRELHVPFTFAIVELLHARSFATPPSLRTKPRNPQALQHRGAIEALLNDQQDRAGAELAYQSVGKSGHFYGIGVAKTWWCHEERPFKRLTPGQSTPWVVPEQPETRVTFDGPKVGYIDIRDFFWDPFAWDAGSMRWGVHRSWQSNASVLKKLGFQPDGTRQPGPWATETALAMTPDDVTMNSSAGRYSESHQDQWRAAGYSSVDIDDNDVHEVLELSNGDQVIVILDRLWPVQIRDNPRWHGGLPFHVYRPIEILGSMVGKGSIEPIEDLQSEIDMLRTDRRWNAIMKLHQTYAYRLGVVDPTQIKIGPGELVGVNGDPSNVLQPLTVGDIPNSSYREEELMVQNLMQASGSQDPAEAGGGQETATGVMAVQQAQAVRVTMAIRRAELELVGPVARDFSEMNRQHIMAPVSVPVAPTAGQPDPGLQEVGPDQLVDADFDVFVTGGLRPDNTAQDRADATTLVNMMPVFQGVIDSRQAAVEALRLNGQSQPETMLASSEPRIPPKTLDYIAQSLVQAGSNPQAAEAVVTDAMNKALDEEQNPQGQPPPGGGPPQDAGAGGPQPGSTPAEPPPAGPSVP